MSPDPFIRKHRGAGLPVALFVITVLALVVAAMANIQQGTGEAVSLQIQSQRALFAAESGAQVGVRQVLAGGACGALTSPKVFSATGLAGCRAVISCESISAELNGSSPEEVIFTLTSAGRCGSGLDLAERIVEVKVR
ncbi:hypothetical protein [Marinobacter sp.]|uniref:hypothetical protein n=1 Tax=Marinobacter sp. TaxID=50741 RepID=UPI003A94973E